MRVLLELQCLVLIGVCVCSIVLGYTIGQDAVRDSAIKAGVAHYVADPQTGKVRFVWLVKEQSE